MNKDIDIAHLMRVIKNTIPNHCNIHPILWYLSKLKEGKNGENYYGRSIKSIIPEEYEILNALFDNLARFINCKSDLAKEILKYRLQNNE